MESLGWIARCYHKLLMQLPVFGLRQVKVKGSLSLSKVLEPDAAEYLFDSLLPDMVQLALRASELCTKVTVNTIWLTVTDRAHVNQNS